MYSLSCVFCVRKAFFQRETSLKPAQRARAQSMAYVSLKDSPPRARQCPANTSALPNSLPDALLGRRRSIRCYPLESLLFGNEISENAGISDRTHNGPRLHRLALNPPHTELPGRGRFRRVALASGKYRIAASLFFGRDDLRIFDAASCRQLHVEHDCGPPIVMRDQRRSHPAHSALAPAHTQCPSKGSRGEQFSVLVRRQQDLTGAPGRTASFICTPPP